MPEQLGCYGLELTAMQDFVITVLPTDKPKIQEIYDRRAKMKLAENGSYAEMANAELILGAAEGLKSQGSAGAGNLAGIGIGVGVGMGLAGKFVDGVSGDAQAAAQAAAAPGVPAQPTSAVTVSHAGTTCAACGAALATGARFCSDCGSPAAARRCPACGATVASGKFCSACGETMGG
jgi:membrane protease subunit (stomatin/prohibitin family)